MRYQLHVVRRCRRGGGEAGGARARGRVEGERCRQTTVRRSSLLGTPILIPGSSRQHQGVICTYQLCLPATKGPSMTSLPLLYRGVNDPMIFTFIKSCSESKWQSIPAAILVSVTKCQDALLFKFHV